MQPLQTRNNVCVLVNVSGPVEGGRRIGIRWPSAVQCARCLLVARPRTNEVRVCKRRNVVFFGLQVFAVSLTLDTDFFFEGKSTVFAVLLILSPLRAVGAMKLFRWSVQKLRTKSEI